MGSCTLSAALLPAPAGCGAICRLGNSSPACNPRLMQACASEALKPSSWASRAYVQRWSPQATSLRATKKSWGLSCIKFYILELRIQNVIDLCLASKTKIDLPPHQASGFHGHAQDNGAALGVDHVQADHDLGQTRVAVDFQRRRKSRGSTWVKPLTGPASRQLCVLLPAHPTSARLLQARRLIFASPNPQNSMTAAA